MNTSLALKTFCYKTNCSADISSGKSGKKVSPSLLSSSLAMLDAGTCAYDSKKMHSITT